MQNIIQVINNDGKERLDKNVGIFNLYNAIHCHTINLQQSLNECSVAYFKEINFMVFI